MQARRRRGDRAGGLRDRLDRSPMWVFMGVAALLAVSACADAGSEPLPPPSDEWTYYGGQNSFNRYSPLTQIDRENVGAVQVLWRRPALDAALIGRIPGA